MSNLPENLKYTEGHEWIRDEGDGRFTIGITEHAQELLGDMVFVELPEVGAALENGDECAVVESVKAASDVYSPLSGEVLEVNVELEDSPEIINDDPYESGWIFTMSLIDPEQFNSLMDVDAYQALIDAED